MNSIIKPAAVLATTGLLALACVTSADARSRGRAWGAVGAGLAAGAIIGAAAASANGYYGDPGYVYDNGPYYGYEANAYAPGYVVPAPHYDSRAYYGDPQYPTRERMMDGRDY